jgi:hypothetical protein
MEKHFQCELKRLKPDIKYADHGATGYVFYNTPPAPTPPKPLFDPGQTLFRLVNV